MIRILMALALLGCAAEVQAAPLKQMPINFVGEWCNGEVYDGETNWKLPSWTDESDNGGKCGNILSVTPYDFSMEIGKKSYSCYPTAIHEKTDTAPSGTSYYATITGRCTTANATGAGSLMTFRFHRYKGNIYVNIQ